jgi:hypothetical protein
MTAVQRIAVVQRARDEGRRSRTKDDRRWAV